MKVKDLFKIHVAGDVYENIADLVAIYYETGTELTVAGYKHFAKALNVPVKSVGKNVIIIDTDKHAKALGINLDRYTFDAGDVPAFVQNLIDLFWGLAGYCSETESETWFK